LHALETIRHPRVSNSSLRSQWVVGRGAPQVVTKLAYEVVAIFGPTASGKSTVARRVAHALGTEVVSADALQVYRGLPILTNQPVEPTHLVAIRDLGDTMSVGEYAGLAHEAIDRLVDMYGGAVLSELDPAAAAAVHVNDRRRVVRALELATMGETLAPSAERLWSDATRRPTIVVGLELPKDELDRRISERTDEMIRRGVVLEVAEALRRPVSHTASKALGLDELATLPLAEARTRIVARTRRYAAYQRKWMRRIPGIVLVDGNRPVEQVADAVLDVARAR